jgi:hypothetical protein
MKTNYYCQEQLKTLHPPDFSLLLECNLVATPCHVGVLLLHKA